MVGWLRGGLAFTTILTCEIFGTVSGSSAATTAAVGWILYPPLRKNHYAESFCLGLVTSTGAIASVVPPSIGMVVYSAITGASVGAVFMGGIGPGVLLGICFGGWVLVYVYRNHVPVVGSFHLPTALQRTKSAGWAIRMPALILGGIYTGVFTPTEASAVSAVYAIFVSFCIYREMTLKKLFHISSIFGGPMRKIIIGFLPFIAVSLVALFLTTYVPDISLWLAKTLYPQGLSIGGIFAPWPDDLHPEFDKTPCKES